MWSVYTVMAYFLLALLLPVGWSLGRTWMRARRPRVVTCPEAGVAAVIRLDPKFAVRRHALGDDELRVLSCNRWPENAACARDCIQASGPCV